MKKKRRHFGGYEPTPVVAERPLCACGCGMRVGTGTRVNGHQKRKGVSRARLIYLDELEMKYLLERANGT